MHKLPSNIRICFAVEQMLNRRAFDLVVKVLTTDQKQSPVVFYKKRFSWKLPKIQTIVNNTFFTEHLQVTASV